MSTMTTPVSTADGTTRSARFGLGALPLGIIAAGLTLTLSLVSLALGTLALVLGGIALARREAPVPAAVGMTAAVVSIVVILQEVFALGG